MLSLPRKKAITEPLTFLACSSNHATSLTLDTERNVCIQAGRQAARICLIAPRRRAVTKSDASPVSAADLAIQATVARILRKACPHDHLIGEEEDGLLGSAGVLGHDIQQLVDFDLSDERRHLQMRKPLTGQRCWVIDPIDGTRGFLSNGGYAMGLALLPGLEDCKNGCYPLLSVLALPHKGYALLAETGTTSLARLDLVGAAGALDEKLSTLYPRPAESAPEHLNSESPWLLSGMSDLALDNRPAWSPLCCGSLVKYAAVAQRQASGFVQALGDGGRGHVWDHAAGIAAVMASGGKVSDEKGQRLEIASDERRRLVRVVGDSGAIVATAQGVDHSSFCADARKSLRRARRKEQQG